MFVRVSTLLLDQHEKFPKGKESKNVGENRGHVKLTSFLDQVGTRVSQDNTKRRPRLDLEAFIVHMHNVRRWHADKAKAEFRKYENDPIFMADLDNKDYKGPEDAPLRLRFPGWLTCTDFDDDKTSNYQDRARLTSSKAEVLSDDHREAMLAETRTGFVAVESPSARRMSAQVNTLQSDAVTNYGGRASVSALGSVKEGLAEMASPDKKEKTHVPPNLDDPSLAGQAESGAPAERPLVDLSALIDNHVAEFKELMAKEAAKMSKEVKAAILELKKGPELTVAAGSVYQRTEGRAVAAIWWIGVQPTFTTEATVDWKVTTGEIRVQWAEHIDIYRGIEGELSFPCKEIGGGSEDGPQALPVPAASDADSSREPPSHKSFINWVSTARALVDGAENDVAEVVDDVGAEEIASFNTLALQCWLDSLDIPMESKAMLSLNEIELISDRIKDATSEAEIEAAKQPWLGGQSDLYQQLYSALQKSKQDLSKHNRLAQTALTTADAAEKKKQEEQRKEEEHKAHFNAIKVLEKKTQECLLQLEWGQQGVAKDLPHFDNYSKLSEFLKTTKLDEPFVASADVMGLNVLKDQEAKVVQVHNLWKAQFPTNKEAILHDNTQAPLYEQHGGAALQAVWDSMLPASALVSALSSRCTHIRETGR